jgi:hypothetical protein
MNCAEAVKPAPILWKPRENPSPTQKPGDKFTHAREKEQEQEEKENWDLIRADPWRDCLGTKQMRPGQPPDRIVRGFLLLPCHRLAT